MKELDMTLHSNRVPSNIKLAFFFLAITFNSILSSPSIATEKKLKEIADPGVPFGFKTTVNQNDFSMKVFVFNPVSKPRGIKDVYADCSTNAICSAGMESLGAAVGIPPGTLTKVGKFIKTVDTLTQKGESHYFYTYKPSGWAICQVYVSHRSTAPASGNRTATFAIDVSADLVHASAHVHRLGALQGKSWWDGDIIVRYVRSAKFAYYKRKGKCTVPASHAKKINWVCKGAKSNDKGYPTCRSISF